MGAVKHAINFEGQIHQSVRLDSSPLAPPSNLTPRRNGRGVPWSKTYNEMMDRCVGYGADVDAMAKGLPCMPVSIVYGHAAARRLDINRWTFGLDTGCVSRICGTCRQSLILHCAGLRPEVDGIGVGSSSSPCFFDTR